MKYIKTFLEIGQNDIEVAGGKAINLGEMAQKGLPVPPGFCLTTNAYKKFIESNNIQDKIMGIIEGMDTSSLNEEVEEKIKKLFDNFLIHPEIEEEIIKSYGKLKNKSVAVRSSATSEDLAYASFAGQQETFLNIKGQNEVINAVKKCWASLWSLRAINYRNHNKISHDKNAIAVVIQELVDAEISGVAFTANPVTGMLDEVVINASWGLGEAIVSGLVTPDTIIIDKKSSKVKSEQICDKQIMTVSTPKGVIEQPVPDEKRNLKVLSPKNITDLVALTGLVENIYRKPMDIEWAYRNGKMYLLQARVITTLHEKDSEQDLMNMQWTREIVIERWIKPITPLSWSYMQESLLKGFKKSMLKLGLDIGEEIPLFNLFYGRVYINQSLINDAMKDFPLDSPIPTQDKEEVKQNSMMKAVIKNPGMIIILMKMLKFLNSVHKEWGVLLSTFTDEFTSKKPVEYNKLKVNELLAELNWNTDVVAKLFDNHADSILAADSTIKILESFLKGGSKPLDKSLIPKLLSGLTGNITVKTNHELWKISNIIRNDKKLYEVISKCKGSKDWFDEVKQKTNNEEFVKIVNNYYEQYGHRLTCYDMVEKPIREQPQVILEMLQMYMSNNVSDPLESEKLKANERELLTKEIISSLPILKRGAFKQILKLTQTYFRLRENQQFYLMKNVPNLRNIVIELGKIFKEKGILKNVDDIFYLEIKEIRAIASKLSNSATNSSEVPDNPLDLVKSRQEYNQRYANYNPPIVLGIKESEVNLSTNSKLIGIAASSGIVKGKACVILSNKDFNKLKKGEILVTIATTPTWTPLFGIAGGIITEFGALLSHSAVVAREYGLPAVLGVQNATKLIKDGDEIIIDGTEGVVYIK